jgi:uncharacterized HAD superfamily protein
MKWKSKKLETITTNKCLHYSITKECIRPNVSLEIVEVTEKHKKVRVAGQREIQIIKRQKFEEAWCKEIQWLNFNHATHLAGCESCAHFVN